MKINNWIIISVGAVVLAVVLLPYFLFRSEPETPEPVSKETREAGHASKVQDTVVADDKVELLPEKENDVPELPRTANDIVAVEDEPDSFESVDDTVSVLTENSVRNLEDELIIEDEVVDEDELIAVTEIQIHVAGKEKKRTDSQTIILEKQSGIKEREQSSFQVEYWQSPFNTKGYKLANRKIILYGLDYDEYAKLIEHKDTLYLLNFDEIYQLRRAFHLRPVTLVDTSHVVYKSLNNSN